MTSRLNQYGKKDSDTVDSIFVDVARSHNLEVLLKQWDGIINDAYTFNIKYFTYGVPNY